MVQLLSVHLTLGEIANDLFAVCCRPDADDGQEHGGAEGVAEVAKEGTRQCDQHRHSTGPGAPPRADSARLARPHRQGQASSSR